MSNTTPAHNFKNLLYIQLEQISKYHSLSQFVYGEIKASYMYKNQNKEMLEFRNSSKRNQITFYLGKIRCNIEIDLNEEEATIKNWEGYWKFKNLANEREFLEFILINWVLLPE